MNTVNILPQVCQVDSDDETTNGITDAKTNQEKSSTATYTKISSKSKSIDDSYITIP
jgi:hypothetical protein